MFKKLIKELKENKYTTIVFCIFLGLFLFGWLLYGMVMPSAGEPVYGNRLDGIEEVEITDEQQDEIVKAVEEKSYVNSASVHISGKIVNVIVEVKEGTKTASSRALNTTVTKVLEDDQISFYDIQLFVTNENENAKGYPIIGYKSATAKKFTF